MNPISVRVELANVGQILACYGLFETADRLWGKQSWITGRFDFDPTRFVVNAPGSQSDILAWLTSAKVKNVSRSEKRQKAKRKVTVKVEFKYEGDVDDPAILQFPDGNEWTLDSWAKISDGRTKIKTFAARVQAPKAVARLLEWLKQVETANQESLFDVSVFQAKGEAVLGLDGRKGKSALDIGFSPDATEIESEVFPATELFAAIGLQHIRPMQELTELQLGLWPQPLPVELARAVASNAFAVPGMRWRRFRLLGRKERSGVSNAQNDQYKTFTSAHEVI